LGLSLSHESDDSFTFLLQILLKTLPSHCAIYFSAIISTIGTHLLKEIIKYFPKTMEVFPFFKNNGGSGILVIPTYY
jgi:hypothetical protein